MDEVEVGGGPVEGEFMGHDPWGTERHCELIGPGSIELLTHGLHVRATWRPAARRVGTVVVSSLAAGVSALIFADVGAAAAAGSLALPVSAGVLAWRRWCRERAFDRVIPWGEVAAGGVSDGLLVFSLPEPQAGVARFRVPHAGVKELRPLAQAIKARARRP